MRIFRVILNQGYSNEKVAVPDQSNIQKEFYVEPQDEPNE